MQSIDIKQDSLFKLAPSAILKDQPLFRFPLIAKRCAENKVDSLLFIKYKKDYAYIKDRQCREKGDSQENIWQNILYEWLMRT